MYVYSIVVGVSTTVPKPNPTPPVAQKGTVKWTARFVFKHAVNGRLLSRHGAALSAEAVGSARAA